MAEHAQRISLDGSTRVTIDVSGAHLSVRWRDDVQEIVASGHELSVDRAGGEIFLRAERRGRGRGGGLFDLLPNISTPGVTINWGGGGNSIEVSDEDGVKINTGLGREEETAAASTISIDLPMVVTATSIEVERGDLALTSPHGKVESDVKTGNVRVTGGSADLTASLGSGNARISGLAGELNVMGGSGNIEISGCQATTTVKAGSGKVLLDGLESDAISLMAGSGNVDIRECRADELSSQTGSGDVDIAGGEIERIIIRSGSGKVASSAAFGPSNNSIQSGSGSVSLGVPRGLPARFEVATQSGEISSEIQLVSVGQRGPRSRRTRRQVGSVGSGEPRADIGVRTASGDIRLYWLQASPTDSDQRAETVPASTSPVRGDPPEADPPSEGAVDGSSEPAEVGGAEDPFDAQRAVLESLARGEITADEADLLLQRIEHDAAHSE